MKNTKSRKHFKKKHLKNHKSKKIRRIPSRTPYYVDEVSQLIYNESPWNENDYLSLEKSEAMSSYSPTINKELVLLQSQDRQKVHNCNNQKAFNLQEPLQIGIPGNFYGKTCLPYYDPKSIKFLLKNLAANKHVNVEKIVPPIQSLSNCWFNTMFVSFFVSDKGRKFFHFFRQLMIEGIQSNGKAIPSKLRNSFALFNYAIDACLTGNKYAYELNTNAIIQDIYDSIPKSYKPNLNIININEAGNPVYYYMSLIEYLHNHSLQLLLIHNANHKWKDIINSKLSNITHQPHIIIIEILDENSNLTTNKPKSFFINGYKYNLDSCVVRDSSKQHFCSLLTCEQKEMAYDGLSFHRLVPLEWKQKINSDFKWEFEGSNNLNGNPLIWNFLKGYQLLIYYRVK